MSRSTRTSGLGAIESPLDIVAPVDTRLFFALLQMSMFALAALTVGYATVATLQLAETILLVFSALLLLVSAYTFGMIFGRVLRTHDYI